MRRAELAELLQVQPLRILVAVLAVRGGDRGGMPALHLVQLGLVAVDQPGQFLVQRRAAQRQTLPFEDVSCTGFEPATPALSGRCSCRAELTGPGHCSEPGTDFLAPTYCARPGILTV